MRSLECSPPAKINLVLRVFQKHRGPLHLIHGLFQTIDWTDRLTISKRVRPGIELTTPGWSRTSPETNLAFRAAQAVIREAGLKEGVRLVLDKRLPDGAGLGGGSSDAAAVIRGMARLWRLEWSVARWNALALSLGSDVPFFLKGGTAEVKGVGEEVSSLPRFRSNGLLLVTFPLHVSTAWAYRNLDRDWAHLKPQARKANLTKSLTAVKMWMSYLKTSSKFLGRSAPPPPGVAPYNDFSPIVRGRFRRVDNVWRWLEHQEVGEVGMTGKGPTLFVCLRHPERAAQLMARLRKRYPECRGRLVAPLGGS